MDGRFGVPAVDRALGDIPRGSLVLLRHDPTLDAAPFTVQAAATQLAAGIEVVYLVTNRSPVRTREALAELGGHPDLAGLHFVDAHSPLMGAASDAHYPVNDPTDLGQVAARLEQAAKDHPDPVLLADSLSGLLDH